MKKGEVMLKKCLWALQAVALCIVVAPAYAEPAAYKISSGDVLEIMVAEHPELSSVAMVIKDGTVALPLVGVVSVENTTVNEVREKLEALYNQNYIVSASVMVSLKQSTPKQFYVNGEVKVPGVYPLHEGVTVLKAVVTAGGFTDYAAKGSVKILRNNGGEHQVLKVNVGKIEAGSTADDVVLLPDDVVVVSQSFL